MEHILLLLAILALVKSVWVVSLWPGKRCVFIFGCICVVFIASVHDYVLELGKPVFDRWISDYDSLMDLSLWAMADLLLTAFQCRIAMQYWFGSYLKFWEKMLLYSPPIIIFPVLFYLHFSFFYWFPGMSFEQGTGLFGVCVLGIVGGGIWGVKKLLPEVELRLELTVLFSLFLFAGIVVCTVLHPSVQVVPAIRTANWPKRLFTKNTGLC